MTLRVPVNPELLHWALRRSGRTPEGLSGRFKKLGDWLEGRVQPTLNQLEDFVRATSGHGSSWGAAHERQVTGKDCPAQRSSGETLIACRVSEIH